MPDPWWVTEANANIQRIRDDARARGLRVALTTASRRLGCRGCNDGENLRHPGSQPFRCATCPVRALGK